SSIARLDRHFIIGAILYGSAVFAPLGKGRLVVRLLVGSGGLADVFRRGRDPLVGHTLYRRQKNRRTDLRRTLFAVLKSVVLGVVFDRVLRGIFSAKPDARYGIVVGELDLSVYNGAGRRAPIARSLRQSIRRILPGSATTVSQAERLSQSA